MNETTTMTHPHPPSGILDDWLADSMSLVALTPFDESSVPLSDSFILPLFAIGPQRNNVRSVYKFITQVLVSARVESVLVFLRSQCSASVFFFVRTGL